LPKIGKKTVLTRKRSLRRMDKRQDLDLLQRLGQAFEV